MHKNQNIFERQYWYDYVDINYLLVDKCNNQYIVGDCSSSDHNHQKHVIRTACQKLLDSKLKAIVIPINIGEVVNGIYVGSHWVGIVIKETLNKMLESLYTDSLGDVISDSLKAILFENDIKIVKDCSIQQMYNTYDCGPWVVFNLDSLAKTGKLPIDIDDDAILSQRLHLQELMSVNKNEIMNNTSNFFNGFRFDGSSLLLASDGDKGKRKLEDINKLESIIDQINLYQNGEINLENALITIGDLAGKITYNDGEGTQCYCIRNRYGYIQRHNNKQINSNGISFEKLFQLKLIFDNKEICSQITKIETEKLASNLSILKSQIIDLLNNESILQNINFIEENKCINKVPTIDIIEIGGKYYEKMICNKIKQEIESFDSIDFEKREDRYFIARILTIVGQLLNEFIEDTSLKVDKSPVFDSLHNLMNIRNILVHHHSKIKSLIGNEINIQKINQNIVEIKNHLYNLIDYNFQIDRNYNDSNNFIFVTKSFLDYLKQKPKIVNINNNNSLKSNIDKLLMKSLKIMDRYKPNSNDDKKLNLMDSQYQDLLKKIEFSDNCNYPDALHINNKKIIKQYDKDLRLKLKQIQTKIIQPIKSNQVIEDNQLPSLIDKLLWKAYKMFTTTKSNDDKQLFQLNNQYQLLINKLDVSNKQSYPRLIDIAHRNIIIKYNEPNIRDRIVRKIQEINDEMEYFQIIESNNEIDDKRKQYIIEHIVMVIGQYVRDLMDLGVCNFKGMNCRNEMWFLDKCLSSEMLNEASGSIRRMRNEGLAHNIWCVDNRKLWKIIINDMMPANVYLEKLTNIMQEEKYPISIYTFYTLGIAFTDIGLYEKAIEYLLKALSKFDGKNDLSLNDEELNSNYFFTVCGINRFQFQIYMNLGHVYRLACRYTDALEILQLLKSKINDDIIIQCNDDLMKSEIANLFKEISYFLLMECQYKETIKLCEKAKLMTTNFEIDYYLFISYWKDEQINKAMELLGKIKTNNNDCIKSYIFMESIAFMCLEKFDEEKYQRIASKCVTEMEIIMNDNIGTFKMNNPNSYILESMVIIYIKCSLLCSRGYRELSINISDIENIQKIFSEIMHILNDDLKQNRLIPHIYLLLAKCYLCFFYFKENKFHPILVAQNYYNKAIEVTNQFVEPLTDLAQPMAIIGDSLASAYNMCYEDIDLNLWIKYLHIALNIQEKYHYNKSSTLHNLSQAYCDRAIEYYLKNMENQTKEFSDNALENFEKALLYCKLRKMEPTDDTSCKSIIFRDDANYCVTDSKNLSYEVDKRTKKILTICYNRIGVLRYDVWLMKKAVRFYDKFLQLSLSKDQYKFYKNQKLKCEEKINSVVSILKYLLTSSGEKCEIILSNYGVDFLLAKFPYHITLLNIIEVWNKSNKELINNLNPLIKQELNYISDESILLYKLYKVLSKMGMIKKI